jgi:voltage-gated potassium channel
MLILSATFLVVYGYEVIGDLSDRRAQLPDAVLTVIWIAFVADYIVNLVLARPRRRWFLSHLWELAIVALPVLRPLRLLRLLSVIAMLQRSTAFAVRGRVAVYVVTATALLVAVAGLAVLDAEQNAPGANIEQIGDAWWWAFATITTVGYGEYYPVTLAGRLVAVVLMGCGVALLGSVTALLGSWLIGQVAAARPTAEIVLDAQDAVDQEPADPSLSHQAVEPTPRP